MIHYLSFSIDSAFMMECSRCSSYFVSFSSQEGRTFGEQEQQGSRRRKKPPAAKQKQQRRKKKQPRTSQHQQRIMTTKDNDCAEERLRRLR
mmetsp:Transcript_8780/g.16566  ORF Transcript_8780/g.16566 Transcript_8780/m.16566 type:complete len:91 (-) Transcript_8780:2477-2749(-)